MAKLQAEEVVITLPREVFEVARGTIRQLAEAFELAEQKVKADESMANVEKKAGDFMQKLAPGPDQELSGFGDQLSRASDRRMGI